jgi:hypothetical protein
MSDLHWQQEMQFARAEAVAERRAARDALRSILAELQDPDEYARYMPGHLVTALLTAWKQGGQCYVVAEPEARVLRPSGLVGSNGRGLTAYGCQVLSALRRQDA